MIPAPCATGSLAPGWARNGRRITSVCAHELAPAASLRPRASGASGRLALLDVSRGNRAGKRWRAALLYLLE